MDDYKIGDIVMIYWSNLPKPMIGRIEDIPNIKFVKILLYKDYKIYSVLSRNVRLASDLEILLHG